MPMSRLRSGTGRSEVPHREGAYPRAVLALEMAVVVIVAFCIGVLRDPRSFGNAVLLGLALALGALGLAEHLADMPGRPERLLLLALALAVALGPFLVACYLLANGITMARRESLRPANLLSLAAGIAILAMLALNAAADRLGSVKLGLLGTVSTLVFGYVSFLLFSYVSYAWIYGQVAAMRIAAGLQQVQRGRTLLRIERARCAPALHTRDDVFDRRARLGALLRAADRALDRVVRRSARLAQTERR